MLGVNFEEKTGNKFIAARALELQTSTIRHFVFSGDKSKDEIKKQIDKARQFADELLEHLDEEEKQ